ncbi:MAG: hypothetical protein QOG53_1608 [Frankiales bacterium]|nr:hypothetical protein [Frankiales bacterium]
MCHGLDVAAGVGDGVPLLSMVTLLKGSRGSAHGNTRRNNNAKAAKSRTNDPANRPGSPPGKWRQIHVYIGQTPPLMMTDGSPGFFVVSTSSAKIMSRCRAEYFGLHVVNVSNFLVGDAPG